jgi:acetyltransferase
MSIAIQPLDESSAAPGVGVRLTTKDGVELVVRSANPGDADLVERCFAGVSREDLRFRFLTAVRHVDAHQVEIMTHPDHKRSETLLAFLVDQPDPPVAIAVIAGGETGDVAEVAISIVAAIRGRGVAWTLLEHSARVAKALGYRQLQSVESRDNRAAIDLEREMGFEILPYPGDATLTLVRADLT